MQDFNTLFPNFLSRCIDLKSLVTPVAFLLLTVGLVATGIVTDRSPSTVMRTLAKFIVLVMFIVYLPTWGNQIVMTVDDTVKNVLKVDPSQIHDQYKASLELKTSADGNKSWWEKLMDWRAAPLEWLLTGLFMFLGWLASSLMWWAYILQSTILYLGYALSPIFIGFLAFQSVYGIGRRYLLELAGVMLWPLGWGVAGLVTEGMISFMTDRSFLQSPAGNELYSMQNFMGAGFLGIWIIFSTIAAPVIIQKTFVNGTSAAAEMLSGGFRAGRNAVVSTAATMAAMGPSASGVSQAVVAGTTSLAAGFETLAGSSLNGGYSPGSLLGSLVQARPSAQSGNNQKNNTPAPPGLNDPTGDKAVQDLLRRTRNPYSQG
jgi:hypothetical protein